jgi:hypothetical protein
MSENLIRKASTYERRFMEENSRSHVGQAFFTFLVLFSQRLAALAMCVVACIVYFSLASSSPNKSPYLCGWQKHFPYEFTGMS